MAIFDLAICRAGATGLTFGATWLGEAAFINLAPEISMKRRFGGWGNTPIKSLRSAVRRNPTLMRILQVIIPALKEELEVRRAAIRGWLKPPLNPMLRAVLEARSVGGGLSLAEFEVLWRIGNQRQRVLCLGDEPERQQMETLLRRGGAKSVTGLPLHPLPIPSDIVNFDVVVAAVDGEAPGEVGLLREESGLGANFVVLPCSLDSRSRYRAEVRPKFRQSIGPLKQELDSDGRVRVVLLNDEGLRFGSGTAQRRQAASLLLNGWDVAVVAWAPGREFAEPVISGIDSFETWLGVYSARNPLTEITHDNVESIDRVVAKVAALRPHVVIVGNIHGAAWPIALLLPRLQETGALVVAYMHDCYFVTGRCAQPGSCLRFVKGCDASCPTPHEYPRLEPDKIANAWRSRHEVFTGPRGVPLVANSNWTCDVARQRFGNAARTAVVHLGLDECLFAPMDKLAARKLLGIGSQKIVVTMGAVDVDNQWKGGSIFLAVVEALQAREDVHLVLFGRGSEKFAGATSLGLVRDERLMPVIYGVADIYVSVGTAESFGQTLLEASACGVPVVAFDVGGVADVVVHEHTGLLVNEISADRLVDNVDLLIRSPELRLTLGQNGRRRVETKFSLSRQAAAWVDYLKEVC